MIFGGLARPGLFCRGARPPYGDASLGFEDLVAQLSPQCLGIGIRPRIGHEFGLRGSRVFFEKPSEGIKRVAFVVFSYNF